MKTILQYATEIENNEKRVIEVRLRNKVISNKNLVLSGFFKEEKIQELIIKNDRLIKKLLNIQENNISNLKIAIEFAHSKLSIQKRFSHDG